MTGQSCGGVQPPFQKSATSQESAPSQYGVTLMAIVYYDRRFEAKAYP
jgi:hypothetical protein